MSSQRQKVVDSIPGQGTYLGCGFSPLSGCIWEATNRYFSGNEKLSLGEDQRKKEQIEILPSGKEGDYYHHTFNSDGKMRDLDTEAVPRSCG